MKLIITIIRDVDNDQVSRALTDAGFSVTMIASTGGFFHRGSTTLLIGVEDNQVESAIATIKENCVQPQEQGGKKATVFVIKVDQFVHF
ncbi:MAG TPA: cyclic-di-AMP receptor [Leptolinea sp.]